MGLFNWLRRKPERVFGYIITGPDGAALAKNMGWGGFFDHTQPRGFFVHPRKSLPKIRQLAADWKRRPVKAYPAIYDPQSGEVQITGGPFDFWQMATWHLPPGSPIGSAPAERSRSDFPQDKAVWVWHASSYGGLWGKGVVVSLGEYGGVYLACGKYVVQCHLAQSVLWPRDDDQ